MKRRCVWAASAAVTSASGRLHMSSHGDTSSSGAGNSVPSKIKSAHSICVHVVPHFGGVLITMSPGRNANPSQRPLSATIER
jgi:hypothetical protein